MKSFLTLFSIFLWFNYSNQTTNVNIKFLVFSESTPDTSNIYITGNHELLANWNPDKVILSNQKNHIWLIELEFPLNTELAFKFTRGDWDSEALESNGGVPPNHTFFVKNDTTIEFQIDSWKDSFMSMNTRKITSDFEVHQNLSYPELKSRDVIVWLPPGYATNTANKYPVLYMNDGQNLFNPNTSFQGIDWQVEIRWLCHF